MASSVSSNREYANRNSTMYYVAPTVTNEYMVHGSVGLDLRDFETLGAQVLKCGTITTPVTLTVGMGTASAATTFLTVKTAVTTNINGATAQVGIDIDELAHLGQGYRYAYVMAAVTATNAGTLVAVNVNRGNPKRAYAGLTSATAITASVVPVTATSATA